LFLPQPGQKDNFLMMLAMATMLKLMEIARIIYRQNNVDIFLIDSEKSHGRLMGAAGLPGAEAPVRCVCQYMCVFCIWWT
jgi:hypothetical protein